MQVSKREVERVGLPVDARVINEELCRRDERHRLLLLQGATVAGLDPYVARQRIAGRTSALPGVYLATP